MKVTHEQAEGAIKAIIEMVNKRGASIGDYVENFNNHFSYYYKTSLGNGSISLVTVKEKAIDGLEPSEETLTLIRQNFTFDE
ncbi:hypothetical protein [Flammeovirga kamogawensis]|uniref:Uncharacterized protein n=1 Tax=Flammeovirga kamogawensis TaxID=373891 RepID=A0ABX8H1H4_9BACT|nr:hypothetical protein [Flammeovirga kamogawensis]MBB6462366.1 hypothetical protein [Flammeovirga kamogawensis]QWG09479.1 hypothetical protein KM029_23010 [Flammeovirga kamogawensis]TRX64995.1 hypothetical protein EO216_20910 [Flammeovirga kamogawensis]